MTEELRCWIVPEIDEAELHTIMKNLLVFLPDGATVLDEDGRFLCLFGGRKDLEYLPSEQVLGLSVRDFSAPRKAERFLATMKQAMQTNSKCWYETEIVLQGKSKLLQMNFLPLPIMLKGKQLVGMYVYDRTDYQTMAERLEASCLFAQQNSFFCMVFNNKNDSEQIISELTKYGINCKDSFSCFFLRIEQKSLASSGANLSYFQSLVLEHCLKKGIQWIWRDEHGFCMLMPVREPHHCREYGEILLSEIHLLISSFDVSLGMSYCAPNSAQQMTELPRRAYWAATFAGIRQLGIAHYDEIGLYKFAFQLVQNGGYKPLIDEMLGPLLAFDATHNVKLMDTLECLLEHQNIKVVAGLLGLHPNTISWRKQKIIHVLGNPLDDFTYNATLALVVKSWRIVSALAK